MGRVSFDVFRGSRPAGSAGRWARSTSNETLLATLALAAFLFANTSRAATGATSPVPTPQAPIARSTQAGNKPHRAKFVSTSQADAESGAQSTRAPPSHPGDAPSPPPLLHFNFPDTPEKRLVEQHCVACHDLNRIQNAGGTRSGWNRRLQRMIARGSKLPLQDVPAVANYLARQFLVRLRPVDANDSAAALNPPTP